MKKTLLTALLLLSVPAQAAPRAALRVARASAAAEPATESILPPAPPFSEDIQRALDELVRAELARGPHAGLSVGVLHEGKRWTRGYGWRDLAHRLPATPRTTYRMASITKSFTAVAVLQLAQEGKLGLDAEIQSLVPDFPPKEWPVTVRELLGHLGGVPNYDGPESSNNVRHLDTAGALALFVQKPLVAEPGTKFVYTTWGYNLLGAAVETASGQGYGDYLREHVFEPAGMRHAALDDYRTRDRQHAVGYRLEKRQLLPSQYLDVSSRFAGGGTRASVEDLLAFGQAMLQHQLVTADTTRLMQTSMSTRDGQLTDYGMGFATYPLRGHYTVTHAGGQPETSTLLVLLPAEDVVLALATNLENDAKRLRRVSSRILETLLEDGQVRREAALADPVDAVVHEGLARLFTYGLAYHQWATHGPGVLPEPGELAAAFTQVSTLLDRARISENPQEAMARVREGHHPLAGSLLIRVGAHMARTLEQVEGAQALRDQPRRGPLAFFNAYVAACEQVNCPAPLRFGESLREDARRYEQDWRRSQVPELLRVRLDEVARPETLWPTLEAATAGVSTHPDYVEEMLQIATLQGRLGRREQQRRWLERAVALHPRSDEARQALAKLVGQDKPAPRSTPPRAPPVAAPVDPVPDNAGRLPRRAAQQE
ncbi:serine hydrolase [Cystobacter fuscus]|uniref:serine hydrolase n=1 Tax=Cystobacter fuscus TaxID=43 RepID=UPI002B2EA2AA|nr:serine hydrolase [Cystobacter fuscus]